MYNFNYELNRIHINNLQAARQHDRVIEQAKRARRCEGGNWLTYWRERREQARLRRLRRAELLRQEWEVASHK